jgi:hypothetical protein
LSNGVTLDIYSDEIHRIFMNGDLRPPLRPGRRILRRDTADALVRAASLGTP